MLVSLGGFVVSADLPISAAFYQKSNEILTGTLGNNTYASPNPAVFYQKSNEYLTRVTGDNTGGSPDSTIVQVEKSPIAETGGVRDETVISPGYAVYVQGGKSSIKESDGMMVITIQDLVPYLYVSDNEKSVLSPVEDLTGYETPLNAALVLSGPDGNRISFLEVSNLSLSDTGRSLTLEVTPLLKYSGNILKSLEGENNEMLTDTTGATRTGIFLEIIE